MQTPLEYYASSGHITDVGSSADLLSNLPSTIPSLCHLIQGVVLHPFEARHYGVTHELRNEASAADLLPPS